MHRLPTLLRDPDRPKPVFALIGDSITLGNTPTSNGQINRGYWHWAQAMSGQRAYCAVYAGIGGNITTQMRARLQNDVIAPLTSSIYDGRPKYCVVMGGVNDSVNASDIIATATGNLAAIYDALLAANIQPIAMTITPTTSADTETKIANWIGINDWLLSYCPANGIPLADNIADTLAGAYPPVATPEWWSGGTHDGVHPTAAGAQTIAKALAAILADVLPAVDHFDMATTSTQLGSVLLNPAMLGTNGTLSSSTGEVADEWKLTGGDGAKAVRGDTLAGALQTVTIVGTDVRLDPSPSIDITTGFAAGDLLVAQAEVFFPSPDNWEAVTTFYLHMEFRDGGTVLKSVHCMANDPYTTSIANIVPGGKIILRTHPWVAPAATDTIRSFIYLTGTAGSIDVGRYEILKLAT